MAPLSSRASLRGARSAVWVRRSSGSCSAADAGGVAGATIPSTTTRIATIFLTGILNHLFASRSNDVTFARPAQPRYDRRRVTEQ